MSMRGGNESPLLGKIPQHSRSRPRNNATHRRKMAGRAVLRNGKVCATVRSVLLLRVALWLETPPRLWRVTGLVVGCLVLATPVLAQRGTPPASKPPDNDTLPRLPRRRRRSSGRPASRSALTPRSSRGSIHGTMSLACVDCHADLKAATDFPHAEKLARVDCSELPRSGGRRLQQEHARVRAAPDRRQRRGHLRRLPQHARHPEQRRIRRRDLRAEPAGHLRPLPRRPGDHQAGPHRDRQRRGAVQGQHPRPGAEQERAAGRRQLHELPRQPRHPAEERSGEPRQPREHPRDVRRVPRRHHDAVRRRRARRRRSAKGNPKAPVCADCHSAHEIQRADVSSWQLDVIRECGTCHVNRIETYRDTFHGQVTVARVRARGDVRGLPRRARHPAGQAIRGR